MSDAAYESSETPDLARDLRVVVGQLRRRLREQNQAGALTSSEVVAIGHLERDGPMTVTALARAEGVRSQSMGATIAALEAAGFVVASPHPTDGRQSLISLTSACLHWISASRAAREDWLHQALDDHLSPEEQQQLARAVTLLQRLAAAR